MATITTTLKINTKQAQTNVNALVSSFRRLQTLTNQINRATTGQTRLANAIRKSKAQNDLLVNSASKLTNEYKKAGSQVNLLGSKLRRLASTYLGVMGGRAMVNNADILTSTKNRFNSLGIDSNDAINKIYASSLASRSGMGDNLSNISKLMTISGKSFSNNVDAAIRFNEILQKSYVMGGASAAEQTNSMYQLIQALGSGVLQGEELKSMLEGAPLAAQAIEEFAQKTLGSTKSLKELASQGRITSDLIVAAVMQAGDSIDEAFKNTDMTFAQLWTNFKTQAFMAFTPVFEQLRQFMNSEQFQVFIDNIVQCMVAVANVVSMIFQAFVAIFNWCAENWDWLKYVLIAIVAIYTTIVAYQALMALGMSIYTMWIMVAGTAAQQAALGVTAMCWPLLIIIGLVVAIAIAFMLWPDIVAGVVMYIAALIWDAVLIIWNVIVGLVTLIMAAIIALIGAIVDICIWIVQLIVDGCILLAQIIANICVGIWNVVLVVVGAIAGAVASMGAGIAAVAYNYVYIPFCQAFDWLKEKAYDFAAYVLDQVVKVANALNNILGVFGVNIDTSGLISAAQSLRSKADAAGANTYTAKDVWGEMKDAYNSTYGAVTSLSVDIGAMNDSFSSAYDSVNGWFGKGHAGVWDVTGDVLGATFDAGDSMMASLVNPMDWYNAGSEWGSGVGESMSGLFNMDTAGLNGSGMLDTFGLDGSGFEGLGSSDFGLPSGTDLADSLGGLDDKAGKAAGSAGKTAANTDKMADSMDLMSDELEYLRDIAEQDIINRYTGVTFNVGGITTNYDGANSLDGIVTMIERELREALTISAEGVHA